MEVTGRLHFPAALSLGTETPVRTQKEAGRLTDNRFASSGMKPVSPRSSIILSSHHTN